MLLLKCCLKIGLNNAKDFDLVVALGNIIFNCTSEMYLIVFFDGSTFSKNHGDTSISILLKSCALNSAKDFDDFCIMKFYFERTLT